MRIAQSSVRAETPEYMSPTHMGSVTHHWVLPKGNWAIVAGPCVLENESFLPKSSPLRKSDCLPHLLTHLSALYVSHLTTVTVVTVYWARHTSQTLCQLLCMHVLIEFSQESSETVIIIAAFYR